DLRRPLPVPRALREPLPARPPDALQGLRARRPLVADQPARPDGHLRARLLAAVEGRADGALRALPARRADGVALLLDVADDSLAVAPRQRFADPEGAVPAAARAVVRGRDATRRLRRDVRSPGRRQPDRDPGDARRVPDRRAARGGRGGVRGGGGALDRVRERPLSRRRAPDLGGAAAVVLPDADPLPARRPPGRGQAVRLGGDDP